MNKTFKIVFNKARGALMVANEATSSVQKKGVRTIVATAVLLAISVPAWATDTTDTTGVWIEGVKSNSSKFENLSVKTASESPTNTFVGIYVEGSQNSASFTGTSTTVDITNEATIKTKGVYVYGGGTANFSANDTKIHVSSIGSKSNWGYALDVRGNSNVIFDGGDVSLYEKQTNYTSQVLTVKESNVSFNNNGNVTIQSVSPYGVTVVAASSTLTFNNKGNVLLQGTILPSTKTAHTNVVGIQDAEENKPVSWTITNQVDQFRIKLSGQGVDNNGTTYSTGTRAITAATGGNITIDSKSFEIQMDIASDIVNVAPQDHTAEKAYAINLDNKTNLSVGPNTSTKISVAEGLGTAYGISVSNGSTATFAGDTEVNVSGKDGSIAVLLNGASAKLTGNVTIKASATDKKGAAAGVKVSTGTVELGGSGKSVSVTAEGLGGADSNSAIALWADSNATLDVKGDTITLNASERGVKAQGGATITLGTAETSRIDITDGDMGIFALQGHVNVAGKALNVNSSGEYGLHVQNNSETETAPDGHATLTINTDKTTIVNTATNGFGLSAFSNGELTVDSNLSVTADHALDVRGNSTVNINTNTNGKHTTQLTGDIVFETDNTSTAGNGSGKFINAYVKATLSGTDSFWNGRSYQEYVVGTDKVQRVLLDFEKDCKDCDAEAKTEAKHHGNVTGFALTLANGAKWTLTGDSFVNSLTLEDGGTVDASQAKVLNIGKAGATDATAVLSLSGAGTKLALGDNIHVTGAITLGKGSELDASFDTAYSGASIVNDTLVIGSNDTDPTGKLKFVDSTEGTLVIADAFEYKKAEDLTTIANVYKDKVILSLTGAKFTGEGTTTLVDNVIQGGATATVATEKAKNPTDNPTATIGVSATMAPVTTGAQTITLQVNEGQKADVTVKAASNVTLTGKTDSNYSNFIENAASITVAAGATLNLGSTSTTASKAVAKGTLQELTLDNAKLNVTNAEVKADALTFNGTSQVALTNATVTSEKAMTLGAGASLSVAGATVEAATLKLDGDSANTTVTIDNKSAVEVSELAAGESGATVAVAGNSTLSVGTATGNAKITVGAKDGTGANMKVENLAMDGGFIFVDPLYDESSVQITSLVDGKLNTNITAGKNSFVTIGATVDSAKNAVSKLDGFGNLGAVVFIGAPVSVGSSGSIVVDSSATAENTAHTQSVYVNSNSGLVVDQAALGNSTVFTGATSVTFKEGGKLGIANATGGTLVLADEVKGLETANIVTDNPFIEAASVTKTGITTKVSATNGLGALASTGMQAMTRRADSVLAQTIADRTSVDQDYATGTSLWVDVTGERYEADKLDNNGAFKSDMGYGAFGGDFAITEDISAGAAIQYGKGTVRSSVSSIKNSIDSYGITAYGSMKFGDSKVVAEASYIKNENDITSSQTALNQSVDTDIYSFGVRGQHRFTAGQFQFVPSVGVRVSRLNTDAMKVGAVSIKKQEQTLVQVPIALRVNGFEQNAGGWSVAPSFKVAYVPTFGDKEISVLGADQTVIDTAPVQGDFGIRAQKGNLMINASFMVGGGKDGTSSVGGKAGLKYVF